MPSSIHPLPSANRLEPLGKIRDQSAVTEPTPVSLSEADEHVARIKVLLDRIEDEDFHRSEVTRIEALVERLQRGRRYLPVPFMQRVTQ